MTSIYNKMHSAIIQSNQDKRKISIKIEIETINNSFGNKEIFIRLTDANSLSFLFCLRINDENFQELKHQQGLLVDFGAFGQKLIDLLQLCQLEENNESPKYILKMFGNGEVTNATASGANWTLNFIETNSFKHLTHLSLKLSHGDAEQFKNYLIECLQNCRLDNRSLAQQLDNTESTLSKKLKDTEYCLSEAKEQLNSLQISYKIQLEELRTKLELQIEKGKDKLIETENYYKSKHDQERRDLENNFIVATKNSNTKIQNLESTNKCLCDENSKLERDVRESKSRYENLDDAYQRSTQEIQNLRRSGEQNEKTIHELECQIQKMNTKLAVLEQEVRDKDQMLHRTKDLHINEQEAKNRYVEENQKKTKQIEKLEKAISNLNEEVSKGNDIIQKLQTDIKHSHSKIKLRTQITAEQEKVLTERESEIKRLLNDMDSLKKELLAKQNELEKANANLEQASKKLEEANHVMKTNENVINWLNRQVTEYELSKQKFGFMGLPPKSQTGTAMSSSTDTTIKYRPISASSNMSIGENHSILTGVGNRGKLLPASNAGFIHQSQNSASNQLTAIKYDPVKTNPNSFPLDVLDAKYLVKSSMPPGSVDLIGGSKFGHSLNQLTRNPISGALSIPEEHELPGSPHQQSLSSAYFPKPILGSR